LKGNDVGFGRESLDIGADLYHRLFQVLLVDDVIALEHLACSVAADFHSDRAGSTPARTRFRTAVRRRSYKRRPWTRLPGMPDASAFESRRLASLFDERLTHN